MNAVNGDILDIDKRLKSLKALKDGWATDVQPAGSSGKAYGKAPLREGLDWLAAQFTQHYSDTLPRPYIYPTPEGGVQAEWPIGEHEATLEIDLQTHTGEWQCVDFKTKSSVEHTLGLDAPDSWKWLSEQLAALEKAAK